MKVVRSPKGLRFLIKEARNKGRRVGFVPTMGYLHEGHLSLVRRARQEAGFVVMSIFVNPLQFGPREDFRRYPRNLRRDQAMAQGAGVDVLFYPTIPTMYPQGFQTYVEVESLTRGLCGRHRPGHFRGVTTVVAKLFNLVQPDFAYFGQKDAQQALVIRRMVEDLNFPIKIRILPIVREADGLAMSSRNAYLSCRERKEARVLSQSLQEARRKVSQGLRDARTLKAIIQKSIQSAPSSRVDYIETVDANSLQPLRRLKGRVLIALAVWIGKVRLIDNIIVTVG